MKMNGDDSILFYNINKGVNSWHCFINYYKTGQKDIKQNDV